MQTWQGDAVGRDREDLADYKLKMNISLTFSNKVQLKEFYHNSSFLENGGSPDKATRLGFVAQIDQFLKQNNINGKILSLFEYGSFIGYNYYPEFKIYVDGRQEQVYDSNTLDELMFFILNLGVNPDLILQKYKPDIILLSEPFTKRTLNNIPEYTKIYSRRGYNIFVLNKHKKDKYIYPKIDLKKYVDDLFAKGFTYKFSSFTISLSITTNIL